MRRSKIADRAAPTRDQGEAISRRALNRALLARQLLLSRERRTVAGALSQVAGLQAQLARPPFVGLWSRIRDFDRADLIDAIERRDVVRVTAMRGTLHLLTSADYRDWRGPLQPALTRGVRAIAGAALTEEELTAAEAAARGFLSRAPATFDALREHLGPRFPKLNVRHLAYSLRMTLPLVQVPETGAPWAYPGAADFALAETWLRKKVSTEAGSAAGLVRRYLAAFGPAAVADAQTWSGLPKLAAVFESLRPALLAFRDERKRELFDLPDAPRPDPDTPAPVRFVPDWDNVLLGHQDRSRVIADEHRARIATRNLQVTATFLIDGIVAGSWSLARKGRTATLVMQPFVKIAKKDRAAVDEEAERLLAFAEPDAATREVLSKA